MASVFDVVLAIHRRFTATAIVAAVPYPIAAICLPGQG